MQFRTPVKNEFVATSTPKISSPDGGFFGSDDSRFYRHQFALSPVKIEDSFNVTCYNNTDSACFSAENRKSFSNVIKRLHYDDSGFESINSSSSRGESVISVKSEISTSSGANFPLYPYLFEPKLKRYNKSILKNNFRVDFLKKFKRYNMLHIISNLLACLPAEDLCRMRGVSKEWKEIIEQDVKANGRRRDYLKRMNVHKENRPLKGSSFKRYGPLSNSSNLSHNQDSSKKYYFTKFESFIREGKVLQNESLMKCPRCSYAAKRKSLSCEYVCTECSYTFWNQKDFTVNDADHSQYSLPRIVIGSKHSKRNLRRL